MITVADFRCRFPEFYDETDYPDIRINMFINDSTTQIGIDETRWCGKYDIAQAYLVAHLLQMATKSEYGDVSASAGAITGKSAGGVSVTRASLAKSQSALDDYYMTTVYGQYFVAQRNICFIGVSVANCL